MPIRSFTATLMRCLERGTAQWCGPTDAQEATGSARAPRQHFGTNGRTSNEDRCGASFAMPPALAVCFTACQTPIAVIPGPKIRPVRLTRPKIRPSRISGDRKHRSVECNQVVKLKFTQSTGMLEKYIRSESKGALGSCFGP